MTAITLVTKPKFYLVWSVRGEPSRKHESYDEAIKEAIRLSTKHPNFEFFVLEAKHCVSGQVCIVQYPCE